MKTQALWTIDDLGAQVVLALADGHEGSLNGRVREVPDVRTIRYYTTLGLLDRPVEMRGRTALYGVRHLQQLVAIKRLQVRGLSLAEIQERLLGLTDAELRRLSAVSARSGLSSEPPREAAKAVRKLGARAHKTARGEPGLATDSSSAAADSAAARRAHAFWTSSPASVVTPPRASTGRLGGPEATERTEMADTEALVAAGAADAVALAGTMQAIGLADSAILVLGSLRPIDEDDIMAIRSAAGPLVKLLEKRRLVGPRGERENQ